ncbi:MAG: hypothetical protein OEV81_04705 [Betaproteobacteria bacterium]|nr:hypothetical protein [Betaproteobacteria bacterium]MDH5220058.1 hypothetical protein [Betaproteobacteria bacterium]MDH5349360.1 hypothetical protein [Betaproteobacteria bacterium]
MDNRCPLCGKDLGRRKLGYSIVARMDVECPHCSGRLSVNVHRAEQAIVLIGAGCALLLAALSYTQQRQALLLAALGAGIAAAVAMFALERAWLRRWPRYVPRRAPPRME